MRTDVSKCDHLNCTHVVYDLLAMRDGASVNDICKDFSLGLALSAALGLPR